MDSPSRRRPLQPTAIPTIIPSHHYHSIPTRARPPAEMNLPPERHPSEPSTDSAAFSSPQKAPRSNTTTPDPETQHDEYEGSLQEQDAQLSEDHNGHQQPSSEDPAQMIEHFDWADFEKRFKEAMLQQDLIEDKIMHEFNVLMQVFGLWLESSREHDHQRATKRVKLLERIVQRDEDNLEKKRQHYVQVVQAFRSALQILQQMNV